MRLEKLLIWLEKNRQNQPVILATGVFDLLHEEHIQFLQKAKQLGGLLVVGIESDSRVKQLKGQNRPIWNQERRVSEIEATKIADAVFVLPEKFSSSEDHNRLIAQIRPNVLAVSSHSPFQEKKREIVERHGGKLVVVHEHNPNVSTTLAVKSGKVQE